MIINKVYNLWYIGQYNGINSTKFYSSKQEAFDCFDDFLELLKEEHHNEFCLGDTIQLDFIYLSDTSDIFDKLSEYQVGYNTEEIAEFTIDTQLKACEAALMYCNTYAGFDGEEPPFTNQDIKDIKLLQELKKGLGNK